LVRAQIGNPEQTKALIQEADELTAIFVASQKTAKRNMKKQSFTIFHSLSQRA